MVSIQTSWILEPCYMPKQKSAPSVSTIICEVASSRSQSVQLTDPKSPNVASSTAAGDLATGNTNIADKPEPPATPPNATTPVNVNTTNQENAGDSFLEAPTPIII